jgi:hypothetical protein
MITRPAETEGKTPEPTEVITDKEPSMESNETKAQTLTEAVHDSARGTANAVPSPKRRTPTFPKCPHRDEAADFDLEPDFIVEEELSTQKQT